MIDPTKIELIEKNPEDAYSRACLEFSRINPEQQCSRGGANFLGERPEGLCLSLAFFNQECLITWPTGQVIPTTQGMNPSYLDKVVILDYLIQAKGNPLSGEHITYAQLPSGGFYFRAVEERTIPPLLKTFGEKPELFLKAAETLGGKKNSYGDAGVTIQVFPRVPVYLALWRGDEEFSPSVNIFYDGSIKAYLDTYDVAMLTVSLVGKMIKFKEIISH